MVRRRRRGEPVWPFFAVLSALLFGVGAVVAVTGTLGTGSGGMVGGGAAFPDPPPEDGPLAGGRRAFRPPCRSLHLRSLPRTTGYAWRC